MGPLRVATLDEVIRYGTRGGHKALRARGLLPPIMGAAGLAIDASTPAYVAQATSGSVTTLVTASFTPPLGSLLVVLVANSFSAQAQSVPTNTGGAVTWDGAIKVNETANQCSASIWLGTVTTSASMTVTGHQAVGQGDWGMGVVVVTGQAATQNGATGINTSTAATPAKSVTTVGANSLILGTIANFSNATVGTPNTGETLTFNGHAYSFTDGTAGASGWAQYITAMTIPAGGTATIDITTQSINYSLAMLEILAPSTSGPSFTPHGMPSGV